MAFFFFPLDVIFWLPGPGRAGRLLLLRALVPYSSLLACWHARRAHLLRPAAAFLTRGTTDSWRDAGAAAAIIIVPAGAALNKGKRSRRGGAGGAATADHTFVVVDRKFLHKAQRRRAPSPAAAQITPPAS